MTSNIKEYIQGCISVWFSYMVGNVFRSLQGRSSVCLARFSGERPDYYTLSGLLCQQLFSSNFKFVFL